jgi:hypothetical protein
MRERVGMVVAASEKYLVIKPSRFVLAVVCLILFMILRRVVPGFTIGRLLYDRIGWR